MSTAKGENVAYTYKGPGYFHGIPAEDLTNDAFAALPPEYQHKVRISPIYKEVDTKQAAEASKTDARDAKDAKDGDKK